MKNLFKLLKILHKSIPTLSHNTIPPRLGLPGHCAPQPRQRGIRLRIRRCLSDTGGHETNNPKVKWQMNEFVF